MSFSRPELLHLLWLAALLPVFYAWAFRKAERTRAALVQESLLPKIARGFDPGRRRFKAFLQITGMFLLVFALAGPRVGSREVTVKRRGIDLMIAIDTSLSMEARDIPPSRLVKAKREVSAFLDRLEGDRIGIVAFAGDAFLQCPLTLDFGAARMFLEVLDTNSVSRPGTNLAAAIRTALAGFPEAQDKYKAIVLVTDGEDHSGAALKAAEEAARRGIRVYTIGVGAERGEPIPLGTENGGGGYKKDEEGEIVMTALDVETLERIALTTGGEFHRATTGELELNRIYESLGELEEREIASRAFTQYEDRFQVPLALALLLLLIDFVLPERARVRREWEGRFA